MVRGLGFLAAMAFATVALADDDGTTAPSSSEEKKEGCICTKEYRPVCSKDGAKQFGNACEARCAGVTDFTQGACGDGSAGATGVGGQTAADCKPGEKFQPFPCLVAPCKIGRCVGGVKTPASCGKGMMRSKILCKPGAKGCKPFICVRRPQCEGPARLRCREGFWCVLGSRARDALGYCYATCRIRSRTTGCYDGEVCEDLKMITPVGVCKEKPPLVIKPGVLKKLCGGPSKIKCAEGFYCLPKYRHINSEGTCVKRAGKVAPK